jgi:hypothetical protein
MFLLFYKGLKAENPKATWFDRLICLLTRSRFSHVELAYARHGLIYSTLSASTRDKGVRPTRIDVSSGHWEVIELPAQYPVRVEWLHAQIGKRYDYLGLGGTLIHINVFSDSDKWFCSELIGTALGIYKAWTLSPEDIYKHFKS